MMFDKQNKKAAPVSRSGFGIFRSELFLLGSLRFAALLFNRRLGRREACDGHAIRAARNVGEADAVAEFHGVRVAAAQAAIEEKRKAKKK